MLSRRPTLPTGFVAPGFSAITRALHSDDLFEVYATDLEGTGREAVVLASPDDSRIFTQQDWELWLQGQNPGLLVHYKSILGEALPQNRLAVAISTSGQRIAGISLRDEPGEGLRKTFEAMLDCIESSAPWGFPLFDPEACWLADNRSTILSALPYRGSFDSPADQVVYVATAFFHFVTGIKPKSIGSSPPRMETWARNTGSNLSGLIVRSLGISNPGIKTISELRQALDHSFGKAIAEPGIAGQATSATPRTNHNGLGRVAGMQKLKDLLLREVIAPIRDPEQFSRYGLSIPNGILLYGPPGCGKTYIARQLAEELGHNFVEVIPSEIASPYIHQSVMRIREIFEDAKAQAPTIIFIDEFEALVPSRSELGGHQQFKSEEVNEFLAHLNSCSENRVFVIAATNRPHMIDTAVRRTGRLDKLIYVGPPDEEARSDMLALHLKGRPVSNLLSLDSLAKQLSGYSASDLRFLVDEAARSALNFRRDISDEDVATARRKIKPSVPPEVEAEYNTIDERG